MKASLNIENVGGLTGENEYTLETDKINVIESSNAGGKTSIVRALTSVLSVPEDGNFDRYILPEAFRLGIKTDPRNPREGFVNIHAEIGSVKLNMNDDLMEYSVSKDGNYIKLPSSSDQRFLLTGIISNESRIIRQLNGFEDYEPDDFRWAVTLLSNAKGYDQVTEILKNHEENFEELKTLTDRYLINLNELDRRKVELEGQEKILTIELNELLPRFSSSNNLVKERRDLSDEINDLTKKIGEKESEIRKISKTELDFFESRMKKNQKRKEEIEKILKNINFDKMQKSIKDKKPKIEKEINKNKEIRGEVDGLLTLFLTAQDNFARKKKSKTVNCPLCNNGDINLEYVSDKVDKLRERKKGINKIILDLINKMYGMERNFDKEKNKYDTLNSELSDIKSAIKNYEVRMRQPKRAIKSLKSTVNGYKERIKDKTNRLTELSKIINKSDEEINIEYTQKEDKRTEISQQLGGLLREIEQNSSVNILEQVFDTKKAKAIIDRIIDLLDDQIDYAKTKAEQERKEAATNFNKNIQVLLDDLNFISFRNVELNKDYRLYVERYYPESKDYVSQQPKTLSTSEKLTIALVLQLALKETYLPKIPFFIIDDIMEDFDDERREKLLNYLALKSKQENLIIVMTKLVEEGDTPKINYLNLDDIKNGVKND